MFAKGVMDRCCKRAGVERQSMQRSDLDKVLPHLEAALLVYKTGREVMAALDRLKRLGTRDPSTTHSFIRSRVGTSEPSKVRFAR
jgi:hypothetical protein